jgi:hypothetical protein
LAGAEPEGEAQPPGYGARCVARTSWMQKPALSINFPCRASAFGRTQKSAAAERRRDTDERFPRKRLCAAPAERCRSGPDADAAFPLVANVGSDDAPSAKALPCQGISVGGRCGVGCRRGAVVPAAPDDAAPGAAECAAGTGVGGSAASRNLPTSCSLAMIACEWRPSSPNTIRLWTVATATCKRTPRSTASPNRSTTSSSPPNASSRRVRARARL